jgi:hypothetical protein
MFWKIVTSFPGNITYLQCNFSLEKDVVATSIETHSSEQLKKIK